MIERSWIQFPTEEQENFSSRVNLLRRLLFGVLSTPLLLHWHVNKTLAILQKVQTVLGYTWTHINPWPFNKVRCRVGWLCCQSIVWELTYQEHKLTWNSTGHSQLRLLSRCRPPWADPNLKNGSGECKLISSSKKKKIKVKGRQWVLESSPQILTVIKKPLQ